MRYEMIVVDDEMHSRNTLATCFPWDELGFHICAQMDNGREALDYIEKNIVHVVFTDICMSTMDGIELARLISLRKDPKPIVVFLSAYDDFKYAQEAIKYGVRYYVLKPSSFAELKESFGKIREELDTKYGAPAAQVSSDHGDEIIAEVLKYCEEHYQEGTLGELANKLFLNISYLSQLIRQKTEMTFSDLIFHKRMEQATLFLQDPNVKVYSVSSMVGYQNPNNFTRAFRKYYGISPSEYRADKII